nr:DNA-directed RNA polymerase subunit omega [Brachybacterium muris]
MECRTIIYEGTSVAGTVAHPEGITNPPIDGLLETVDSKYALVLYASQRARQINAYYSQLSEGLLEFVGPLVDVDNQEKSLSIALREIDEGLLTVREIDEAEEAAAQAAEDDGPAPLVLGDDAPEIPPSDFSF